jgi:Cdc6-like AAA superfamily ATPase
MINQIGKHPLRALNGREWRGGNQVMKRKRAIVILDLVDESVTDKNDNIARELFSWFREDAFSVPWVKDVKGVTVKAE